MQLLLVFSVLLVGSYSFRIRQADDDFPEYYESHEEDDFLSAKFKPEEVQKFLESLEKPKQDEEVNDGEEWKEPLGFAAVAPDVVLERLIDEADEKGFGEEGEHFQEKDEKIKAHNNMHQNLEDIDDDLDNTL